jgi:hypothetical protein
VDTDYLFFDEQIIILPLDDEESYVKILLDSKIKVWNVPPDQTQKVRVRIKARGYSNDRSGLVNIIRRQLQQYTFADPEQPDISQVKVSNNLLQSKIAEQVKRKIDELDLKQNPFEPDRDDIILAVMNMIYGGK